MQTKTRTDYRIYAKLREVKYEEDMQFTGSGKVGVKIDFDKFGKILEAKNRMLHGDDVIIDSRPKPVKKKLTIKKIFMVIGNLIFPNITTNQYQ